MLVHICAFVQMEGTEDESGEVAKELPSATSVANGPPGHYSVAMSVQ